ncbi:hypothetical protein N0V94_008818 [Neodidymelliopsis sp. IMI 364377]|nr:hypothetical protein N0V94_008818 [Neodidymelliopsis sp. IMI 364377]
MFYTLKNVLLSAAARTTKTKPAQIANTSTLRSPEQTTLPNQNPVTADCGIRGTPNYRLASSKPFGTSSNIHSDQSKSSFTLSDRTTASNMTLPPVDLGDKFEMLDMIAVEGNTVQLDTPVALTAVEVQDTPTPIIERRTTPRVSSEDWSSTDEDTVFLVKTLSNPEQRLTPPGKLRQLRNLFAAKYKQLLAPKLKETGTEEGHATNDSTANTENVLNTPVSTLVMGTKHEPDTGVVKNDQIMTLQKAGHQPDQTKAEEQEEIQDEDEDEDDDEEDDEGQGGLRCDWSFVNAITDDRLIQLVWDYCLTVDIVPAIRISFRTRGASNLAVGISVLSLREGTTHRFVVRIPANGTTTHWTSEDAYMLEREVQLIEHIRQNTSAPVPKILQYSTGIDDKYQFPYTLMTMLPGETAFDIWFDRPYDPAQPSGAYRLADVPSTATKVKRVNFLRSLARIMTEIQQISFDKIGMPLFSEDGNTAGPSYHWGDKEDVDEATERPAFETTQAYVQTSLTESFTVNPNAEKNRKFFMYTGIRKFLDIIFSQSVFNSSEPESFTIHHNDLDLQNILVDEEGNVTGIIDWDKSFAAPRCMGAAAVPLFLRSDWFPRYTNDLRITPHMAWNQHYYRQIYAAAMVEAGAPDAKYTLKSAIYQSAIASIYEGGDIDDLIDKLLRYIPECRVNDEDFKLGLGMSWPAAVEMLEVELKKIFEPELPRADLLEDLDKELRLNTWWTEFDELLEEDEVIEQETEETDNENEEDEDGARIKDAKDIACC